MADTTIQMLAPDGTLPNDAGCLPTGVSGDGGLIVMGCHSTNLVSGVDYPAVYVWDQFANTFEILTRSTDGSEGVPSDFGNVSITHNGRYILFDSRASDLVPGGTTALQTFLYDRETQVTQLVSAASDGTESNGDNMGENVTPDGRFAVFASSASNLVSGGNGDWEVYMKDLQTQEVQLVSQSNGHAFNESINSRISENGQYVIFQSDGGVYLATLP